jgi:hypothetical protein
MNESTLSLTHTPEHVPLNYEGTSNLPHPPNKQPSLLSESDAKRPHNKYENHVFKYPSHNIIVLSSSTPTWSFFFFELHARKGHCPGAGDTGNKGTHLVWNFDALTNTFVGGITRLGNVGELGQKWGQVYFLERAVSQKLGLTVCLTRNQIIIWPTVQVQASPLAAIT